MNGKELIAAAKDGKKVDIIAGELVLSEGGFLTASFTLDMYVLYVDQMREIGTVLLPKTDYRGRIYHLKKSDCVTLAIEWLDRELGIKLMPDGVQTFADKYKALSNQEFLAAYRNGQSSLIGSFGFRIITSEECQRGDIVILHNHVAVALGDDKALHHLPNKLSGIDPINWALVTGVYRHGN